MPGGLSQRIRASRAAFARALANPALRRVQIAWAVSLVGSWSYGIALVVYTYDVGGAKAVGLLALFRQVPAALVSPFTAGLADRFPRTRVMVATDAVRAATMFVAAIAIALDWASAIVFACAIGAALVGTAYRPAQASLLPSLARDPEELASANVVSSTVESVGIFAGPALGGLLLAVTGADVVFALNGASFLLSVALVAGLVRSDRAPAGAAGPRRRLLAQATEGFRAARRTPGILAVVLEIGAQAFVYGGLSVLVAVLALDLLDLGAAGVGLFNSALGVGGLVGSVVAFLLVARSHLGSPFSLGIALWGLPLVAVGIWPNTAVALALFALVGCANTIVDVTGYTIIQRGAPEDRLGSVFGALQASIIFGIGAGAGLAPVVVAALGERGAFVAYGALLPVLALLTWRPVSRADRPAPASISLLQGVPMLAPLSPIALERLARALVEVREPAGAAVIRAGEAGDRFYVLDAGEVEIEGKVLGAGAFFGEIALLRDVPRTATVTARTDVVLQTLDREQFIAAVTSSEPGVTAADAVIAARLESPRAAPAGA